MVRGIRIIDRPLVRRFRMVVTKLRPPMVKEAMKNTMAMIQSVCPMSEPGMASRRAESGG